MKVTYKKLASGFALLILLIIYDANTGGSLGTLYVMHLGVHADKFAHFILFGLLSFILNLALELKRVCILRFRLYRGSLIVGIFTVIEELSQLFIATRTFDLNDLLANFAGIFVFAFCTHLFVKRIETFNPR